ncbi:MAG TPA: hypothetical protein VMD30_00665 [Tepidisphaeraceae bacterium]|nr:hypothetical protein [Tepidisphaeraceae bacterium]
MNGLFKAWMAAALPLILNYSIPCCPAAEIQVIPPSKSAFAWSDLARPQNPPAIRFASDSTGAGGFIVDISAPLAGGYAAVNLRAARVVIESKHPNRTEDLAADNAPQDLNDSPSAMIDNETPLSVQATQTSTIDIVPAPLAVWQTIAGLIAIAILKVVPAPREKFPAHNPNF